MRLRLGRPPEVTRETSCWAGAAGVNRSLVARLERVEAIKRIGGPLVAFPDRSDPLAFSVAGIRYVRSPGEAFEDAMQRVVDRIRPGADWIAWPVPIPRID